MGNCPGCLSNRGSSLNHPPDFCEVEDGELISVLRSPGDELFKCPAPLLVKDVMPGVHGFCIDKPIDDHPGAQLSFNTRYDLKPLLQPSPNPLQSPDSFAQKLYLQSSPSPQLQETPGAMERLSKKPKALKKVRFAEEPALETSSCSNEEGSLSSVSGNGELQREESSHEKQSSALLHHDGNKFSKLCFTGVGDAITSVRITRQGKGKSLRGMVRLKVVISKRDFTELMSPNTPEKQAEAMVDRMIAPLLIPSRHSPISQTS
ncbi:hypothetical protein L7F22_041579 [Adiantum nelumboides]|nr:hypothetical protein [Adiantum nelumboides]